MAELNNPNHDDVDGVEKYQNTAITKKRPDVVIINDMNDYLDEPKNDNEFIDNLATDMMFTIEPVELAQAFYYCHFITRKCFEMCLQMSDLDIERHAIFRTVLTDLSRPFNSEFWHVVICMLCEKGYVFLAQRIGRSIRKLEVSDKVAMLSTNITSAYRGFYMDLRHVVEQGSFVNPRDQFALIASQRKELLMKARGGERDMERKMADKYAAALIIALDIPPADEDMAIFLQAPDKNMARITNAIELKRIASLTTNGLLTKFILYSRLILVYAFAGNNEMSENMLSKAKKLSYMIGASPELAEMYYFQVYYLLQKFEQDPTADTRNEIEANVLAGLDVLRVLDDDMKSGNVDWQQFLLMKLISCLVGIGNHCTVIQNCVITDECIEKARKYLAQMDAIWVHVETRRRMLYYLTKGRLEEICKNLGLACHYLRKSIRYARKGHYVEVGIMEHYLRELTAASGVTDSSVTPRISEIEDEASLVVQATDHDMGVSELQYTVTKTEDVKIGHLDEFDAPKRKENTMSTFDRKEYHVPTFERKEDNLPKVDRKEDHVSMFNKEEDHVPKFDSQHAGFAGRNGQEDDVKSTENSVKSYEMFDDGEQHHGSQEAEAVPPNQGHEGTFIRLVNELQRLKMSDSISKPVPSFTSDDMFGDGRASMVFKDVIEVPAQLTDRGEPDGLSNPD